MWKWFVGGALSIMALSVLVTYLTGKGVPADIAVISHVRPNAAQEYDADAQAREPDGNAVKVGVLTHDQEHLTHRVRPVKQPPLPQGILPQ